jgi:hypothetical protein
LLEESARGKVVIILLRGVPEYAGVADQGEKSKACEGALF